MDKIGLITITYNSGKVLSEFLDCVWKQSYSNFLLYVIDNGSIDNTVEILNNQDDIRLKTILNKENIGVAAGNNQGIKNALAENCDQILIINNDVEFEYLLIEKLLDIQKEKNCSIVAPKIKYYDTPNRIWYAGSWFSFKNGYLPIHRGMRQEDNGQFNTSEIVEYAPTCCVLVKKEVFTTIGFMDERYFVYFDDVDFSYRIFMNGSHKMYYYPDIDFYHKVGSLTNSFYNKGANCYRGDFFLKQNICNHVYFLKKVGGVVAYIYVFWLFFKNNIKFFFNKNIRKNFATFILINKSYFRGLRM